MIVKVMEIVEVPYITYHSHFSSDYVETGLVHNCPFSGEDNAEYKCRVNKKLKTSFKCRA